MLADDSSWHYVDVPDYILFSTAQSVNTVLRLTPPELHISVKEVADALNQSKVPSSIQEDRIPDIDQEYISKVDPFSDKIRTYDKVTIDY